jgi:hypothetical protein
MLRRLVLREQAAHRASISHQQSDDYFIAIAVNAYCTIHALYMLYILMRHTHTYCTDCGVYASRYLSLATAHGLTCSESSLINSRQTTGINQSVKHSHAAACVMWKAHAMAVPTRGLAGVPFQMNDKRLRVLDT